MALPKLLTGLPPPIEYRKSPDAKRGRVLRIATASSDNGTICEVPDLKRSCGIVQSFRSRSNSRHRASATSDFRFSRQQQELHEWAVGVADAASGTVHAAHLVVVENALAGCLLADEDSWLQAIARAMLDAIHAAIDRPIEDRTDVPENVVSMTFGAAVHNAVHQLNHVGLRNALDWTILPAAGPVLPLARFAVPLLPE